jgi:hypothetical protein
MNGSCAWAILLYVIQNFEKNSKILYNAVVLAHANADFIEVTICHYGGIIFA